MFTVLVHSIQRLLVFISEFDTYCDLGGKGYNPEKADYSGFVAWLQCYSVDGMKSIQDHNGRTMWFKVS